VQVLTGWIVPILGSVGSKLAALERADHEARQTGIVAFQQAVRNLA
jgi:hypothetical protein